MTRPARLIPTVEGDGATAGHETETEIEHVDVDLQIENSGTFEDLYELLERLVADLEAGRA